MAIAEQAGKQNQPTVITLGTLAVRDDLMSGKTETAHEFGFGPYRVQTLGGEDSLWIVVKRGAGGFALRTAYAPGPPLRVEKISASERGGEFRVTGAIGTFRVVIDAPDSDAALLRCTVRLTPAADVAIPYWPRDLYPLDAENDPTKTEGNIEAAQRGLNSGVLYLTMRKPDFGSLLYFQNWTSLNDYFNATETTPDGRVGGDWPELGYEPPVSRAKTLKGGQEVTLSDAYLNFSDRSPSDERETARLFLDLLAGIYAQLERPATAFHSWPRRAAETLRDLENSPKATLTEYGYRYLYPYTETEKPDSMVQLTVLLPLREFAKWRGEEIPLADELRRGVPRFFDVGLNTLRRFLPTAHPDKDIEEVDSWYLYHPLANLGRLAKEEDAEARDLFLKSLEYGIKAARHFDYDWPVQFKLSTFEVIKEERKDGDPGQSDAGGLYAYVMLQAHELTGEAHYLEEAKNAIQATKPLQFELSYQTNITAWGATACLWLWRVTGEEFYREQSDVFLASFFHNTIIWESEIKNAQFYDNFLGATAMHDGPYMATYECFESFAAFHEYMERGGDDLPDSVRLLLSEYSKYALHRAWYAYPQDLPQEALATEIRNGQIDRLLAFPLEDLYADGQPAGQVGQEIYGCGAAFAFTSRAFKPVPDAPFLLFSEYPIQGLEAAGTGEATFRVIGAEGFTCKARLIPKTGEPLPAVFLSSQNPGGKTVQDLPGTVTKEGDCEFVLPANRPIVLRWESEKK